MTPTFPTETPTRPKKKMWRGMKSWLGRVMGSPVAAPELRLHRKFRSQFLQPARTLIVYVPPGYEENAQTRYPVLYMHDGQNLFDFFFQAEDGIRDKLVTGVQTCALPISTDTVLLVHVIRAADQVAYGKG